VAMKNRMSASIEQVR